MFDTVLNINKFIQIRGVVVFVFSILFQTSKIEFFTNFVIETDWKYKEWIYM